jgi:DNA-binding transcriptional regulator YdaS (Cro superfamily)
MTDPARKPDSAFFEIVAIRSDPRKVKKILDATGITRQALWQWRRVPLERVIAVSRAIRVAPHRLRPDHYPPPRKRRGSQPDTQNET